MRDFAAIAEAWAKDDRTVLDALSAPERRALGLIASGAPAERELEAAGREFVLGVKASGLFRLAPTLGAPVTRAGAPEGTVTFVFSDETVDRAGDIVRQNFMLSNYGFEERDGKLARRADGGGNPVVLWGHALSADMMADVPIGRTVGMARAGTRTLGDIEFAEKEYEFAGQVARLARAKFINAGSIAFRPLSTKADHSDEERTASGLGKYGAEFLLSELLEYSLCAVPCNPNALQNAVRASTIKSADADLLVAVTDPTEREWEKWVRRRARAHVALGAAGASRAHESSTSGEDGGAQPAASTGAGTHVTWRIDDAGLATALRDLNTTLRDSNAAREDDAASRRMLARAITDLGQRLGAPRAGDPARSGADAGALSRTELQNLSNQLTKLLKT